jgi:hypothetical protein
MSERKTTAKTAIAKQPQPHGGALNRGGTPGNAGGTGRPPSAIRATAREEFDKLLPRIVRIARAKSTRDADRIRAVDMLGKYGMDQALSVADVRAALEQTVGEIRAMLPGEQADTLVARIRAHWMKL